MRQLWLDGGRILEYDRRANNRTPQSVPSFEGWPTSGRPPAILVDSEDIELSDQLLPVVSMRPRTAKVRPIMQMVNFLAYGRGASSLISRLISIAPAKVIPRRDVADFSANFGFHGVR
jgi:hypothetical protein